VAQTVQIVLTDDLDGADADETIAFALDGISYEIDLSSGNAEALREALAAYVDVARRVGGRSSRRSAAAKPAAAPTVTSLAEVREWARENGYEVSDRGRVSNEIRTAYDASH
jgi:Lsr2